MPGKEKIGVATISLTIDRIGSLLLSHGSPLQIRGAGSLVTRTISLPFVPVALALANKTRVGLAVSTERGAIGTTAASS